MAASEGASSVTLESGIEEAFKAWGLSHHIPKLLEEGFKTVSELLVVSPEDLKTELGFDKLADRSKLRHHLESLSSPPSSSSSSPSSSPSSSSSTSEASAPPAASAPPVDYFARSTVRELISALQGKRVSLLVGSGWSLASTSKPGQPPPSTLSWPGLLRNGIEYVCQLKTAAAAAEFREEMQKLLEQWELVTAASKICHFLLNEVENPQHFKFWLQGAFEAVVPINQTLGAVIRHLVDDFDIAVTTTNYDNVLEDQLGRVPLHRSDHLDYWTEWLQNLNDARKKVVHWHGHYRRPEDVVLDETQYQNMIKDPRNKNFQIAMGVAATTTTLLFLGCGQAGLSDPNWGRLLKRLNSLAISRTFALCTVGELPAFSGVPGVIAIPYGEKHTDLDAFLVRLYNAAKGIDSTELSAASSTSRSIAAVPPPSSSSSSSSSASTSSSPSSSSSGAAAPKPFPESSSRPFFAVDNSTLYKVSPENGQWQAMPGSWPEVKGGTYSPATSSLYVFHKTTLYRVSTEDGKWQAFSGSWTQPQAAASCGDHLYVLDTGILYRVSPLDGSWEPLDTTWIEGKGLAAVGDSLYSVAAGILYRIASADASHTAFAGNWTNLSFLTAAAGALFAVDGTTLYRVSPEDGTWKALPGSWSQVKALTGTADHLFIVNNTTLYRVSPQDGTWQAFPGAWKATSWLF